MIIRVEMNKIRRSFGWIANRRNIPHRCANVFVFVFFFTLGGTSAFGETFPVRKAGSLRVLSYNVKKGNSVADIAKDIKHYHADVILLQEVDYKTKRSGGQDQVTLLKESLHCLDFMLLLIQWMEVQQVRPSCLDFH